MSSENGTYLRSQVLLNLLPVSSPPQASHGNGSHSSFRQANRNWNLFASKSTLKLKPSSNLPYLLELTQAFPGVWL